MLEQYKKAALGAGIGQRACCTTLNKMCASGMKAVSLGAQSLLLNGDTTKVVVAGGFESMSNAPYLLQKARFGMKMGHGTPIYNRHIMKIHVL